MTEQQDIDAMWENIRIWAYNRRLYGSDIVTWWRASNPARRGDECQHCHDTAFTEKPVIAQGEEGQLSHIIQQRYVSGPWAYDTITAEQAATLRVCT
jgi:hypothetical protein